MNPQLTIRMGLERRGRLERAVSALNARDKAQKTNATHFINAKVDEALDALEAELGIAEPNREQS